MKGFIIFVILVVVGLTAYWARFPNATTVTLALGEQNNSGESGTVMIRDDADHRAHVIVRLLGEPAGASQPMHFHGGSCKNIGAVKYTLFPVVDGKSETILDISTVNLMKQLPMAVNVHRSASELGPSGYVACGNVR